METFKEEYNDACQYIKQLEEEIKELKQEINDLQCELSNK